MCAIVHTAKAATVRDETAAQKSHTLFLIRGTSRYGYVRAPSHFTLSLSHFSHDRTYPFLHIIKAELHILFYIIVSVLSLRISTQFMACSLVPPAIVRTQFSRSVSRSARGVFVSLFLCI